MTKKKTRKKTNTQLNFKETDSRSRIPDIEAPPPEDTRRNMDEIIGILVRKQRSKIRKPINKLPEEVKQVKELVRVWKDWAEVQLKAEELEIKRLLLAKADTTDVLKLQQNILNISSDDLKKALTDGKTSKE